MAENLEYVYNLLNERGHSLVICEYRSEELRETFEDKKFLPRYPLLAFCRISDKDLIRDYIIDNEMTSSFKISSALAKIGFAYFDATICVGIQKTPDCYKITTFDSYTNTELYVNISSTFSIKDIIDYIAADIECKSNQVEEYKTTNIMKRTK